MDSQTAVLEYCLLLISITQFSDVKISCAVKTNLSFNLENIVLKLETVNYFYYDKMLF